MRIIRRTASLAASLIISFNLLAQKIDSVRFFTDEDMLQMSLKTDLKALGAEKGAPVFLDGNVTFQFADNSSIGSAVGVSPRGVFRRGYCKVPPMMIDFRHDPTSRLSSLGKLKLVLGCGSSTTDEELLLKEYICYKLYNLLEDKSFRVRLVKVNYEDIHNKVRPYSQYAFFIEDDAALARRNGCHKKAHQPYMTETTDRPTMTMVAIFQYMIGNTDWAVPNEHNIKLIFDKKNPNALPYAVPYDFDYCGLVDASYAVPNEIIGTESVTERVYRGFPRTMDELQETLDIYRKQKNAIYDEIRNFSLLSEKTRRTMTSYLDDFFKMIENKKSVELAFIENARKN